MLFKHLQNNKLILIQNLHFLGTKYLHTYNKSCLNHTLISLDLDVITKHILIVLGQSSIESLVFHVKKGMKLPNCYIKMGNPELIR